MRRAQSTDAAAVAALVRDAYEHYVPRIGAKPGPMLTDYASAIADQVVWVEEGHDDNLVGVPCFDARQITS